MAPALAATQVLPDVLASRNRLPAPLILASGYVPGCQRQLQGTLLPDQGGKAADAACSFL
jgi:hypothetical protein